MMLMSQEIIRQLDNQDVFREVSRYLMIENARLTQAATSSEIISILENNKAVHNEVRAYILDKCDNIYVVRKEENQMTVETIAVRPNITVQDSLKSRLIHVVAGHQEWTPTDGELEVLRLLFEEADIEANVVATRGGVSVSMLENNTIHVEVGAHNWRPDESELQELANKFKAASPTSNVIATRTGVQAYYVKD